MCTVSTWYLILYLSNVCYSEGPEDIILYISKLISSAVSQFTGACFIHRKVRVLCFSLPVLYLKGQINFISHYC